ncbi:MAG: thioredoxin family protein [Legionellaceae bacterium]|nr:thioredoxin family protein [Legionellaceae bacterium]
MPIQEISEETFEPLIQSQSIVIMDFWAEWCVPCKTFALIFAKVAEAYPQLSFASVNIETATALAEDLSICSVPHIMIFKKGIAVYSESGSHPESTLRELIGQALVLEL